jgi:hypothetical protein
MVTYTPTSPSGSDVRNRRPVAVTGIESIDALTAARAEALFISNVSAGVTMTREEFKEVVRLAVLRYGGVRGCAAEVAAAYGDHPETAAPRMRWARQVVAWVYGKPVARSTVLPRHLLHAVQ